MSSPNRAGSPPSEVSCCALHLLKDDMQIFEPVDEIDHAAKLLMSEEFVIAGMLDLAVACRSRDHS
jgi:hypothetical protein